MLSGNSFQIFRSGNLIFFFSFQDVSHNSLTSLPYGIGYLQRLVKLNASENQIKELPVEIGDCFGKF